jgi:uncharacterized protein (DUF169 family)
MNQALKDKLPAFLERLGIDDPPVGIYFTDTQPEDGLTPDPMPTPTREREEKGEIDWPGVFQNFTCVMGVIWRARRKGTRAWFSAEHFGCPGAAFWLGFMKPQTETIIHYVSSGIPDQMEGELYCDTPEALRATFEAMDPPEAPGKYCVVEPLDQIPEEIEPKLVAFFARPEVMAGLHQLAYFVTNDPEVTASPWGAACTSLVTWPRRFLLDGRPRAVVGGWDISGRKFFRTDELSLSLPYSLFESMLERWEESFLPKGQWEIVRKKIDKSRRAWEKK